LAYDTAAKQSMKNPPIREGKLDRGAAAEAVRQFLADAIRAGGFQLTLKVTTLPEETSPGEGEAEVFADLDGPDKELLLEGGGEVLKSLEHLAHRVLQLEPQWHEKIQIDCAGYRALRLEELKMTARVAAERVQATRQPFELNPMSSRERRIVHLALKEFPAIRTESIGSGERRQVVIHPAAPPPKTGA
jgi:spoIIIJ-associated protein